MKLKTLITVLFIAFSINLSFASFPVERMSKQSTNIEKSTLSEEDSSPLSAISSEKSQGIALILALTLGLLAAHRWYLGCPTIWNIFFIFTFGGLGIWLLIDIIRILTGDLNPKGRFKKEFF